MSNVKIRIAQSLERLDYCRFLRDRHRLNPNRTRLRYEPAKNCVWPDLVLLDKRGRELQRVSSVHVMGNITNTFLLEPVEGVG